MQSKAREPRLTSVAFRRFLGFVLQFPGTAAWVLTSIAAGGVFAVVGPLVVRLLIDEGIERHDTLRVAVFAGTFLAVETVRTFAETSQNFFLRRLSHSATSVLRREV